MQKRFVIALLSAMLVMPSMAFASMSVAQDSCRQFNSNGKISDKISFSIVNFDNPTPICGLHFAAEGQPPDPACIMVACTAPAGWTCSTNSNGGADYLANNQAGCISAPNILGGFSFTLDPEFCCYRVWFTGPTGGIMGTTELCYSCVKVGVGLQPWGSVKQLYRD